MLIINIIPEKEIKWDFCFKIAHDNTNTSLTVSKHTGMKNVILCSYLSWLNCDLKFEEFFDILNISATCKS